MTMTRCSPPNTFGVIVALCLCGCPSPGTPDGGAADGALRDAGQTQLDGGMQAADSGRPDAAQPDGSVAEDGGTNPDAGMPDSGSPSSDAGNAAAVQMHIEFPPPSATIASSIIVRGTTVGTDMVTALSVAGQTAQTTDGFAHWQVTIPLALGSNPLPMVASTALGPVTDATHTGVLGSADEQSLTRGVGQWPGRALGLCYEPVSGRVLLTDDNVDGLYAVNPDTGDRTLISDSESGTGPGTGFAIVRPTVVTALGNTAWVADPPVVVKIDLATGDRVLAAGGGATSTGPEPGTVVGLAVDPGNAARILLLNGEGTLMGMDATSGNRTVISSDVVGAGPTLQNAVAMAVDAAGHHAYALVVYQNVVVQVDLSNGNRANVLASGAMPRFNQPEHIAWVEPFGIFVWSDDALFAVDVTTGAKTPIQGAGALLRSIQGLASWPWGLLTVDYVPDWEPPPARAPQVFAIDPLLGTRVVVAR